MLSNTLLKDPSITSGQVHTTSPRSMIYTEGLTPSSLKHSFSLDHLWKTWTWVWGIDIRYSRIDALFSVMSMSTSQHEALNSDARSELFASVHNLIYPL